MSRQLMFSISQNYLFLQEQNCANITFENIIHFVSFIINLLEFVVINYNSHSLTVSDHILITLDEKKYLIEKNNTCLENER